MNSCLDNQIKLEQEMKLNLNEALILLSKCGFICDKLDCNHCPINVPYSENNDNLKFKMCRIISVLKTENQRRIIDEIRLGNY